MEGIFLPPPVFWMGRQIAKWVGRRANKAGTRGTGGVSRAAGGRRERTRERWENKGWGAGDGRRETHLGTSPGRGTARLFESPAGEEDCGQQVEKTAEMRGGAVNVTVGTGRVLRKEGRERGCVHATLLFRKSSSWTSLFLAQVIGLSRCAPMARRD